MKSSIAEGLHRGMIINYVRFHSLFRIIGVTNKINL